ncbi:MAG: hypothetical protein U1G07_17500 [Verrucomicrobiota bacterium]
MKRRSFLRQAGVIGLASLLHPADHARAFAETPDEWLRRWDACRPTRAASTLGSLRDRVGAAHVAGKYCLTPKPFLREGADQLLALGTRVGKFWFNPDGIARSYPFNSRWPTMRRFLDLAESEYFQELFAMPFSTLILEAHTPVENGWLSPQTDDFYERVQREFYVLAARLYRACHARPVTIVLQHWEGDWLLRGRGGELWKPPPPDWRQRCERMVRWLRARQAGVAQARAEQGQSAQCIVAHAAEVNRVADLWDGIPTMTEHVLPEVELDLVSYSCYDGLRDPLTLWKCLTEIQRRARPTALFGKRCLYIGEIGIPRMISPSGLRERWDQWLGGCWPRRSAKHPAMGTRTATNSTATLPRPDGAVHDPQQLRGFWLVKPDGSLSETGRYFTQLWRGVMTDPLPP